MSRFLEIFGCDSCPHFFNDGIRMENKCRHPNAGYRCILKEFPNIPKSCPLPKAGK